MSLKELHDEHTEGWHDKEGIKFGLKAMSWYGWGSPVGLGIFLVAIGGFIYLIHLAGIIG